MRIYKPAFWDYKKPSLFSYLLLPLTLITNIYNFFNDQYPKKKYKKIFSICIGNIYLGGTGKTPTVIELYKILNIFFRNNIIVGKKYYPNHLDEQILLKKKTQVLIDEKRDLIIRKAIKKKKKIIFFDDGLQDKSIDYDLKFACFDTQLFVGNGLVLPSGPLRENLLALKNYDGIFLKVEKKVDKLIIKKIKKINPSLKIFETYYKIKNFKQISNKKKYIIFSGIGNPNSFKKILAMNQIKIIDEFKYPDHHQYNDSEIDFITEYAQKFSADILTTEKDYVKIPKDKKKKIQPVKIELNLKNKKSFIQFVKEKINEKN